jgi:hypothetical protein
VLPDFIDDGRRVVFLALCRQARRIAEGEALPRRRLFLALSGFGTGVMNLEPRRPWRGGTSSGWPSSSNAWWRLGTS